LPRWDPVTPTSIRFIAQRPSQSSATAACQLGSATSSSAALAHPWTCQQDLAAVEADRTRRPAPTLRPPPRPCRGPHSAAASASIIAPSASSPAAKQNRAKLAVISSKARSTGHCGTPAAGMLSLVMAVPAARGFEHPEPTGSRRATPLPLPQHQPGHAPAIGKVPMDKILAELWPVLVVLLLDLAIFIAFPQIVMFLPQLMRG
jgi:hypothetical protein